MIGFVEYELEGPNHRQYEGNSKMLVSVWYPAQQSEMPETLRYRYLDYVKGDAFIDAPMRGGSYPVIVFSHGSHGYRLQCWRISEQWAKAGYIVVSMDHRGTCAFDAVSIFKYWDSLSLRYLEVVQSLEKLVELPKFKDHLAKDVEGNVIAGIAGHSMGTLTALGAVGSCPATVLAKDILKLEPEDALKSRLKPFKTALLLSPCGYSWAYTKQSLKDIDRPIMVMCGDSDWVTPHRISAKPIYDALEVEKFYALFDDTGHSTFTLQSDIPLFWDVLRFFKKTDHGDQVSGDMGSLSVAWFDLYLKEKPESKDLLSKEHITKSCVTVTECRTNLDR
jgi:alpha-beta hydrolase superfamily lysophospholipase